MTFTTSEWDMAKTCDKSTIYGNNGAAGVIGVDATHQDLKISMICYFFFSNHFVSDEYNFYITNWKERIIC